MPRLFDTHLDLAWNAVSWKRNLRLPLAELNQIDGQFDDHPSRGRVTISFPELRDAGLAICLGTMMGRVPYGGEVAIHGSSLDFPDHESAYGFAHSQLGYYRALEQAGEVRLLTDAISLAEHWNAWQDESRWPNLPLGLIPAMEGADAICRPSQAAEWFAAGLRCVSLVHYGSSQYAAGTGDDGPVTAAGIELLKEFDALGMILDTTHLCDQSFYQALDHFQGPLVASHQNCRALVPGDRQFSDEQIKLILQRDGLLGTAFDAWMLYPNWERGKTSRQVVSIEASADHIDHICQLAGDAKHICLGTDLDGGYGTEQTPTGLEQYRDLQKLSNILSQRGYSTAAIQDILGGNGFEFFQRHLPNKSS